MRRADVAKCFSRVSIQASWDLALYKELAPGNLDYDFQDKTYLPAEKSKLIFGLTLQRALYWFQSGLGYGLPQVLEVTYVS
ncbi:MAG TPA: hypothetical protein DCQ20_06630 [Nitrospira sp.]|nr:hypothetical protein [Nitrospira sp.]